MKTLFVLTLFMISTGAQAAPHAAQPPVTAPVLRFACEMDPDVVVKRLHTLEGESKKWIDTLTDQEVDKRILGDDPDIQWAMLLWPEQLSTKIDYYIQYQTCAKHHTKLRSVLTGKPDREKRTEYFANWENCIRFAYREALPAVATRLLDCYKKLLGPQISAAKTANTQCPTCEPHTPVLPTH